MKLLTNNNIIRITSEKTTESHSAWDMVIRFIFIFLFGAELVLPIFNSTAVLSKSISISRAIAAAVTVLIVCTAVTLLMLFLEKKFKRFWIFAGGFIVLAAAVGLIFNKAVKSGGIVFYNSLLANWNQKYGSIVYFIDAKTGAENLCLCLAAGLAAAVLTVLVLIMIKYRRFIELTVLSMVLFFAEVLASSSAPVWAAIWSALAVLIYVVFIDTKKKILEGRSGYYLVILIIAAVFSAAVILIGFFADGLLSGIQKTFITSVENIFYKNLDMTEGNLPLESSHSTSDEVKLTVKGLGSESLYLRGFVGSEYTGTKWVDLDESAYKNNSSDDRNLSMFQKLSDPFKIEGEEYHYTPLTSLAIAWEILLDQERVDPDAGEQYPADNEYTIKNVSASTKYIYAPYGMLELDGNSVPAENKDLNYKNGLFSQIEEYDVSVLSIDPLEYYETKGDDLWEELTADEMKKRTDISEFIQREQNYRDYCNEHYTAIAGDYYEGDAEEFESFIKSLVSTDTNINILQATNEIREYLKNTLTYADDSHSSYGSKGADADYVINLVENDNYANSVQFATLATLLLRAKGIPARYVEGYFIEGDENRSPNSWVDVTASDAHAWVEIYRYGFGWVPIEVTPGYYEEKIPGQNPDPSDSQNNNDDNKEEESSAAHTQQQETQSDNAIGKLILIILIIIFAVFLLIIARRVLILYLRKKKINSDDKVMSLKAISAVIVKNSRLAGINLRNDIPIESCAEMDALMEGAGGVRFEPVAHAMGHAFYSSMGPSQADVVIARKYMEAQIKAIYEPKKWWEKIKLKYITVIC